MVDQTEALLVEKAKHDSKAFSELYDRYYSPIYRYILHRTADVPTALDLTSNVFFKALKGIKKYTWRDIPFSAWLYKVAGNEVMDYFRKRKRAPLSLERLMEAYDFEPVSLTDLQEEIVSAEDELRRHTEFLNLYEQLLQLDQIYQEVITLRYLEKKKIKEIAIILGRSEGTVKSQISRGITRLQEKKKEITKKKELNLPMQPIPTLSVIPLSKKQYEI